MDILNGGNGGQQNRRRTAASGQNRDEVQDEKGIFEELEKLRSMVDEAERQPVTSPAKTSIDGSFMSTVFAVVLVMILSVSIYAFHNLYKAVIKRFSTTNI